MNVCITAQIFFKKMFLSELVELTTANFRAKIVISIKCTY